MATNPAPAFNLKPLRGGAYAASKGPAASRAVQRREGGWLGFQRRALTADLRHIVGSLRGEAATGTHGAEHTEEYESHHQLTDDNLHNVSRSNVDVVAHLSAAK